MAAIGICNKYLSENISSDKMNNLLHPSGIQFIKNIIQQQLRSSIAARFLQKVKLS